MNLVGAAGQIVGLRANRVDAYRDLRGKRVKSARDQAKLVGARIVETARQVALARRDVLESGADRTQRPHDAAQQNQCKSDRGNRGNGRRCRDFRQRCARARLGVGTARRHTLRCNGRDLDREVDHFFGRVRVRGLRGGERNALIEVRADVVAERRGARARLARKQSVTRRAWHIERAGCEHARGCIFLRLEALVHLLAALGSGRAVAHALEVKERAQHADACFHASVGSLPFLVQAAIPSDVGLGIFLEALDLTVADRLELGTEGNKRRARRIERIVQPRPRIVSIEKRGKHARILVAHRAELCELLSRKPIRRDRLVEITTREFAVLGHIVEILAVVGAQETRDMTHLLADIARALETFARGRPSRARDFTEIRAQLRNAPPANRARSNHERYGGERDERNICCDLHG